MRNLGGTAAVELSRTTPRGVARSGLAEMFRHLGIASADLDARLLVCAACGVDRAELVRDPDRLLGAAADVLTALAGRRIRREPVSRILGRREFWSLDFAITSDVLDPRPETEGLVGAILDAVGGRREAALRILDLGTGSGAILGALLHELPRASGVGIDRSSAACRVARDNLEALGLTARASIACASWGDSLDARFDIVVSNPPYIRGGDLAGLDREVREYDPRLALDGGADGLDAYRAMATRITTLLAPGGVAAFECGFDQGQAVAALLRGPLAEVALYKDLAGHERVVLGWRP